MGLSFKKKNKKGKGDPSTKPSDDQTSDNNNSITTTKKKKNKFGVRKSRAPSPDPQTPPTPQPTEPTIEMVPQLTEDLAVAVDTSGEQSARALRMLFSLSEHSTTENNRAIMVQGFGGRLIPVLLDFLQQCERSSSEQYLALLVLNNVSIPAENKSVSCSGKVLFSNVECSF